MRYLPLLLAAVLMGCSKNPNWKDLALKCAETMEDVRPAVVACAAHMKKDHPSHSLSPEGELKIRTK